MATYDARPEPHRANAGAASAWLSGGWKLFMAAPAMWILVGIVCFMYLMLASIPGPGSIVATVCYPLFAAGLMECSRVVRDGGELTFESLFAGLRRNTGNLIVTGLLLAVASMISFAIWGIIVIIGGGLSALSSLQAALNNGLVTLADLTPFAGSLLLALAIMLILMTLIAMAAWFAPALVLFDDMPPVNALKTSFTACLRNLATMTGYSILAFLLMFVAMITILGLLVAVPVVAASVYLSYRDIFH